MLTTNTIVSERSLYSFYKSLLMYIQDNVLPLRITWWSIEGFWSGFQLNTQEQFSSITDYQVTIPPERISLKPQAVEIDERLNMNWRLKSPIGAMLTRTFFGPIIATENIALNAQFIRVRGNCDIDIYSASPLFIQDCMLNMLGHFSNKYTYIPLFDYPLILPFSAIQQVDDTVWTTLSMDPKVKYSYLGVTGESHYYINMPLKPLIKFNTPSYSVIDELQYQLTFSLEFNASLPSHWIVYWWGLVENIHVHLKYNALEQMDFMAALVDINKLGFIPLGHMVISDYESTLMLTSPYDIKHIRLFRLKNTGVYDVEFTYTKEKIDEVKYKYHLVIIDQYYKDDVKLFYTEPPIFYWGYTSVDKKF